MRRIFLLVPILALAACDLGLGTGPDELTLDDLGEPAANSAVIVLTRPLGDGRGYYDMSARTPYYFVLRTPPPLPRLVFDTQIGIGSPSLVLDLAAIDQTGVLVTGSDDIDVAFTAPDGVRFEPRSTCRITLTSAWADQPGARLRGKSDCPVTDGGIELRVLFKFDYTVPAG